MKNNINKTGNIRGFMSIVSVLLFIGILNAQNKTEVKKLMTEYKTDPVGIDILIPRLSWQIEASERGVMQTAYEIMAAKSEEDLKAEKGLLWDSKKVNSEQSVNVEYGGGALQKGERVYWQVRIWDNKDNATEWSQVAYWEMGLLKPADWKASWIEPVVKEDTVNSQPSPMLRKEFKLKKNVKQARLYVSSHGLYLLDINGKSASDQLFTPGWTSYNKRLQYQTYDVTKELNKGNNAIGVMLGDGWYRGFLAWDNNRNVYGKKLGLILQLEITYEDNSKEMIVTDKKWKSTTGPILKSDIYNGETYDARLEKDGWNRADYNDSKWNGVEVKDYKKDILVATYGPPVKRIEEIKPVKIFKSPKGETLVDLGQNMVGWIQLDVTGKAGDKLTIKYAEVLDKKGNFYTENLRAAKATDVYILKGGMKETFEPHFTFHGFRYIKIEGYPGELRKDNVRGIVIHSDMQPSGSFECSDYLINQLQHNIVWGLKGNFLDVPTDCPQRDERLGWTGDAQVFAPTACFNMDAVTFYTKWMKDFTADQFKSGSIPYVIPNILHGGGAAGWADACVVIPWTIYKVYGDKRILKEQYETMKGWVEYINDVAGKSHIWNKGGQFGDWLAYSTTDSDYPGATTDKDLIATAYFARSTDLLSKIAGIIGKTDDAEHYKNLYAAIKKVYDREFITATGRLSSNTQTAYVLSLDFGLLPDTLEKKAAERLAKDVEKFGHLTTGFLGTPQLCQILTKYGYTDLAYMLVCRTEYPSWLYPITMGATTIWERWDGIKPDSTFQDKDMNSFNHYAYGAIGSWLYSTVAGIQLSNDAPAYKKIIINPAADDNLSYAKAEYESVYGKIKSDWKIENGKLKMDVVIPANTTAEIYFPTTSSENIMESMKHVSSDKDLKFVGNKNGHSVYQMGSGEYKFEVKLEKAN